MKYSSVLCDTYEIEHELDAGRTGAVYKAWHKRLRKHVIIKEIRHSYFINEESRRNEVEALKRVKSLYLPQVFDFLSEEKRSFTVMEFIEGDCLGNLLKQHKKFSQYRVIEWYGQLATALVELHEFDICHGDIKPSNIMLRQDGKVCLIDFNVAIVKGNDTHIISRSHGYASPEQNKLFIHYKNQTVLNGENIDWKLSDIHNLGAAMYHILTGKRMKYDTTGRVLQTNFDKWQAPDNANSFNLPPCLFIIQRSTHPNPDNRFSSATALSRTIQSLLSV